jgi:hypothetical protein
LSVERRAEHVTVAYISRGRPGVRGRAKRIVFNRV